MTKISPTAIIHPLAQIDENVAIGDYSIIGEGVHIAKNTIIHSHVVIPKNTVLGEGCIIYPFSCIGQDPQDVKYKGGKSYLYIGKHNIFREHVTVSRGTNLIKGETIIGDSNLFLVGSHIGHDCLVGNHNIFSNGVSIAGHVKIADHVVIGGHAAVHQHLRIGNCNMIGGLSGVRYDLPPYGMLLGGSGHYTKIRTINITGLKRQKVPKQSIRNIYSFYQHISQLNYRKITYEFLKKILDNNVIKDSYVKNIIDFYLEPSSRGITSVDIKASKIHTP